MEQPIRVGIIGARHIEQVEASPQLPGVSITGLWFRNPARARTLANQLGLPVTHAYDHWQDLIEQGDIDAISLALGTTPPPRKEAITLALERGLHVLVQSRLSFDLAESRELARVAQQAKTVTAMSFEERYTPVSQAARSALQEGAIGELLGVSASHCYRFTLDPVKFMKPNPWARRADTGGGAVRLLGGHEFDRVRFLTGLEFTKVIGRSRHSPIPETSVDDSYLLLAELTNEVLGDFHLEFMAGQRERRSILVGADGTLALTDQGVLRQGRDDNEPVPLQLPEGDQAPEGAQPGHEALRRLLADFCAAIRRGDIAHESVPHLPTFSDGLRVQEIIAAAERSEAEHSWVDLAEAAE